MDTVTRNGRPNGGSWNMGQSTNHLELVGSPGICEGPASRVRFLAGAPGSVTETNHVTIPAETPLFFTILAFEADNTCLPHVHYVFSG